MKKYQKYYKNLLHILAIFVICAIFGSFSAATAELLSVELISKNSQGAKANSNSNYSSINLTGSRIAFESDASDLTTEDENGLRDIFYYDQATNKVIRASVNNSGQAANGMSFNPMLSGYGKFIVFSSEATNLLESEESEEDYTIACHSKHIYLRDLENEETSRLALVADDGIPDATTELVALSATGRYVAFISQATNIVSDLESGAHLFIHDRENVTTKHISKVELNSSSERAASFSADGSKLAFTSLPIEEVSSEESSSDKLSVYVYNSKDDKLTKVCVNSDGEAADAACYSAAISANGRYVVFSSAASNLVDDASSEEYTAKCSAKQVYIHDLNTGNTSLISKSLEEAVGDGDSQQPSLSANGRYVAYASTASNLLTTESEKSQATILGSSYQIYVYDTKNGKTFRASETADGTAADDNNLNPQISGSGLFLSFTSQAINLSVEYNQNDKHIYVANFDLQADSLLPTGGSVSEVANSVNDIVKNTPPDVETGDSSKYFTVKLPKFKSTKVKAGKKSADFMALKAKKKNVKYLYKVQVAKANGKVSKRKKTRKSSIRIRGLKKGQDYDINYLIYIIANGAKKKKTSLSPTTQVSW